MKLADWPFCKTIEATVAPRGFKCSAERVGFQQLAQNRFSAIRCSHQGAADWTGSTHTEPRTSLAGKGLRVNKYQLSACL